jgi:hypothetical protein
MSRELSNINIRSSTAAEGYQLLDVNPTIHMQMWFSVATIQKSTLDKGFSDLGYAEVRKTAQKN